MRVSATRVDYDNEAERYSAGRGLPLDHFDAWRGVIEPHVTNAGGPVLDIGAGTGIWTRALVAWFAVPVIAVEPSSGMRQMALEAGLPVGTSMVGGRGEAIPLRGGSVGTVWMSTVVHHLTDLNAGAAELARVLRPGGALLIRNSFPFRHDEIMLFSYFVAARRAAEGFPTVDRVTEVFTSVGFEPTDLVRVREPAPPTLQAFREWAVAMRTTDSALVPLTDEEFADGLRSIDADIGRGADPIPLGLDCLVLTKSAVSRS